MTTALQPAAAPAIDARLDRAYAACREIARARARNFYYGLKLTPEPRRSAVYSVYAWMRRGDDEADAATSVDARRQCLARFRATSDLVLAGGAAGRAEIARDPVWTAFAHTVDAYGVEATDILAMLEGLEEDLDHAGYETDAELESYCRRVASSVGRVCLTIWGLREGVSAEEARTLAERRGLAFQLTNILRDFAEDHAQGRIYLPSSAFTTHALTPDELRSWARPRECEAFVRERAALTRAHYDASAGLERMIDPTCAPTLWAMTRIYSGLLEKIEKAPRRVAGQRRIRLQSLHKAGIALRAVMMSRRDEW